MTAPSGEPPTTPLVQGEPLHVDDEVYRRVSLSRPKMFVIDSLDGHAYPSKAAFEIDKTDYCISVFSHIAATALGLGPGDLARTPNEVLLRFAAARVRAVEGLDVLGDPWPQDVPEPEHPRNGAHALISALPPNQLRGAHRRLRDELLNVPMELVASHIRDGDLTVEEALRLAPPLPPASRR